MFVLGGLNLKQDIFEWMAIVIFTHFPLKINFSSKLQRAIAYIDIYTYKMRALTIVVNGVIVVEKNTPQKMLKIFMGIWGYL